MMLKVGDKVSNPVLLYAVGGYVIFPIILSLITLFIILKFFPNFVKRDKDPQIPSYFLWIVITIYGSIFGVMSILRYLSFHNGVFDFGVFDHIVWNIAKQGNFRRLASGHFFPVLIVYALFYKLYSSGMVLLIAQTVAIGLGAVPLYYIAKGKLGNDYYGLLIVVIYFLYSPVQYNNLFDFHTDHLIILIMFLGFYFLEKRNALAFVLICLAGLTIKEPLILSMAAMGLYAISRYRMYKSGSLVLVGSLLFFFWVINVILPQGSGTSYGGGFGGSFSYLGSDVFEIGKILVSHPWIILKEMNVWKIGYLVFIFFPLLLLPLMSPLSLIPTIPAIAISLLSRLPTYYWIQQHYTASVIAPVFISLIYGVVFLSDRSHYLSRWFKKFFSVNLTRNSVVRVSLWTVLIVSLYCNVVLSPSPISLFFWKKIDGRYYHRTSYVAKERDRVLHEAIKKFIPQQASVTSQNSVYNAHLFHRTEYYLFPEKIGEVDYVVLDRKRTHFVGDIRVDENEYEKEFTRVLKTHKIVFSYDGMYIFKKI